MDRDKFDIKEENPFTLSIGDLMAAVLFVFILLLAGAMLQINEKTQLLNAKQQKIDDIAQTFVNTNDSISAALEQHFGDNLVDWGAELDPEKLSIRFTKKSMFDQNKFEIKPEFQKTLDVFFPEYMKILSQYKDDIEEIRIEGHTSSEGDYFHNMQLSQDRSREVLNYCYKLVNNQQQCWMREKATANGLSSSHLIFDKDKLEDVDRSRRVEFKVVIQSKDKLEEILNITNK